MAATGTSDAASVVVALEGEIDLATVGAVDAIVDDAIARGAAHLVVEVDRVTFMGVCAVPILARAARVAAERGGRLLIRGPSRAVTRLLDLAGLGDCVDRS